jgi:hypothetical protein
MLMYRIFKQETYYKLDTPLGSLVIFINDIEEEIGITDSNNKNKPYYALDKISQPSYTIDQGITEKINKIYS